MQILLLTLNSLFNIPLPSNITAQSWCFVAKTCCKPQGSTSAAQFHDGTFTLFFTIPSSVYNILFRFHFAMQTKKFDRSISSFLMRVCQFRRVINHLTLAALFFPCGFVLWLINVPLYLCRLKTKISFFWF